METKDSTNSFAEKKVKSRKVSLQSDSFRLAFLFVLGLVLSWSLSLIMIAPAPLISGLLLSPKNKGRLGLLGLSLLQMIMFVVFLPQNMGLGIAFVFVSLLALAMSEMLRLRFDPRTVLVGVGGFLGCLLAGTVLFAYLGPYKTLAEERSLKLITEQGTYFKKENAELLVTASAQLTPLLEFFEKPDLSLKKIRFWSPGLLWGWSFVLVWISLFIVMRSSLVWRMKVNYPFTLKDFLKFKASDWLIYPLLIALLVAVGGDFMVESGVIPVQQALLAIQKSVGFPLTYNDLGMALLFPVGIFYFFQGIGVYFSFMSSLRLPSFLVSFLVIMTLMTLWELVAIIGVLDVGLDLRRFLKRKQS
jgi:hypothetical protein